MTTTRKDAQQQALARAEQAEEAERLYRAFLLRRTALTLQQGKARLELEVEAQAVQQEARQLAQRSAARGAALRQAADAKAAHESALSDAGTCARRFAVRQAALADEQAEREAQEVRTANAKAIAQLQELRRLAAERWRQIMAAELWQRGGAR
jgi:hypothetical protein